MGYTSIHFGEALVLMTYRSDGFFGKARFSYVYASLLFFNFCALLVVLYVPFVSNFLGFAPLTWQRFLVAMVPAVLLVVCSELIKIEYRRKLNMSHALLQQEEHNRNFEGP